MTEEQEKAERQVQRYIDILDSHLQKIEGLKGQNSDFINIQDSFKKTISSSIAKAKGRIEDVKNGTVWDNLVIAFFGETNAGKSTIIETFRILFGEKERLEMLSKSKDGVDGLIVGTGVSDCTQIYKEYKMNISGVPFTLIDVPGIEGNEGAYEEEIKNALNKAHYVFYVQGQNKKPDTGTATKIKKYLQDWVKVYSIYNVRGVASNYDEQKERDFLLKDGNKKVEEQIKSTFSEILGDTYQGNITVQAYLALCSKANFAPERKDLRRGQKKLLEYFGDSDSVLSFSQFQSLINVTETKASNFKKEIVAANVEKHKALLKTVCDDLESISSRESQNMIKLKESIHNFQENVKGDFAASKNRIKGLSDRKYNSIFDQIYEKAACAIDVDINDKEYFSIVANSVMTEISEQITNDISDEIKSLNEKIDRRKHSLDQAVSYIGSDGANLEINVSLSFDDALKKLDFNFDDIAHYATAAIGAAFVAANFWNPVGIGLAIATVLLSFFTGRSKKAQAKAKAYEEIYKAKKENKQKFDSAISKICTKLNKSRDQIVKSVGVDGTNVESLKGEVTDVIGKLKIEISKLNIM
jgi:ElaB/YqjD/DUF883 family membrane-anchored ribosome-binding protein